MQRAGLQRAPRTPTKKRNPEDFSPDSVLELASKSATNCVLRLGGYLYLVGRDIDLLATGI